MTSQATAKITDYVPEVIVELPVEDHGEPQPISKTNNLELTNEYISKIEEALRESRTASVNIFKVFTDAYCHLSNRDFEYFKNAIRLEKSTITKMTAICKSDVLLANLGNLPDSWSFLYRISTSLKEEQIQDLITAKKLSVVTSREELETVISEVTGTEGKKKRVGKPGTASDKYITAMLKDATELTDTDKGRIRMALKELEKYFVLKTGNDSLLKLIGV